MAPWLWPKLACLWALVTLATCFLVWLTGRQNSPFAWYFRVACVQNLMMWWAVYHATHWHFYLDTFYLLQLTAHILVIVAALHYAFDIVRWLKQLPNSIPFIAGAVYCTILCTGFIAAAWRQGPIDDSQVLFIEHAAQMAVCGMLWVACFVGRLQCPAHPATLTERLLYGSLVVYSFGIIAAALRIYIPQGREWAWGIDLVPQLGVCAWWIRSLWAVQAPAARL